MLSYYRKCATLALEDVQQFLKAEEGQAAVSALCHWIFQWPVIVNRSRSAFGGGENGGRILLIIKLARHAKGREGIVIVCWLLVLLLEELVG